MREFKTSADDAFPCFFHFFFYTMGQVIECTGRGRTHVARVQLRARRVGIEVRGTWTLSGR